MKLLQYVHTAVLVSNLEKAEHFYGAVLGLPKVDRVLKFPGVWYQLGDIQIHLIVDEGFSHQPPKPDKLGRDRHLAFTVENLSAAKERLLTEGCMVQMSASGRAALFTQDPDGNVIELNEAV
ncbi:VOC family protein [Oscillatoria sp. FACHB-1407]|uniref:VOC family protein n=1 Tax=Oscillatoria sp. FACHB-1407 TaxID=2692847 RepID=UPI0016840AB2|nr:VOC family protein [Oscillatoria sp. FACHB-1407]MBD2461512.1 VOC family protein [Oscillatoria sp. FACHB-1407]